MKYLITLSPAKSLDWESELPFEKYSEPIFKKEASTLMKELRKKSVEEISGMMKISPKLAGLNADRYQIWSTGKEAARPAIYAYNGDVYEGFDAYSLDKNGLENAQKHLRIITGLYGILRPLDLIHPYRLEMSTPLEVGNSDNLYEFWKDTLTNEINKELSDKDYLIDLASKEYSKSVVRSRLKAKVITPQFYDYKNGQYKIISFYAKKARGLIARYILDKDIKDIEELKGFDRQGYFYNEPMSQGNIWVFTRG
ncbi:MAG: peroxide stress protein YaaA [Chitinophagales bacterium]|nr:peroxide stress protein YaaA [Chitinophagales bacterium]